VKSSEVIWKMEKRITTGAKDENNGELRR